MRIAILGLLAAAAALIACQGPAEDSTALWGESLSSQAGGGLAAVQPAELRSVEVDEFRAFAAELCDGVGADEDADGRVDEGCAPCTWLVTRDLPFYQTNTCLHDGSGTGIALTPMPIGGSLTLKTASDLTTFVTTFASSTRDQLGQYIAVTRANIALFDIGEELWEDQDGDGVEDTVADWLAAAETAYDSGSTAQQRTLYLDLKDLAQRGATLDIWFDAACGGSPELCDATDEDVDGTVDEGCRCDDGNEVPVVASATLDTTLIGEATTVTCLAGAVTDPDGDSTTVVYDWLVNGTALGLDQATLTGTWFDKGDTVRCSVRATDGMDTGAPALSATATVRNSAPVVTKVLLSPRPVYETSTLNCNASTWSDPDGDTVTWTYRWIVSGAAVLPTGPNLSGTWFDEGNVVLCVAFADDGADKGAAPSGPQTVQNSPPTLGSVSISPAVPTAGQTLTANAVDALDVDPGDTVTVSWQWYVNGVPVVGATATTFSDWSAGDLVKVVGTPHDGSVSGTPVESGEVTASNTAPVLSSVSLTPSTAFETSTLTCTPGTVTDLEGDAVTFTYAWTVNGLGVGGATSSTLTGSSFSKGQNVSCTATPYDGATYGLPVTSAVITIQNSPPSITGASLTPDPATELSTLICAGTSPADPDGDTVTFTYVWTVDGLGISPTTKTLTGTWFSRGQVVQCTVTPGDGTTSGTSRTSSLVTVGNSAPTLTGASISPASPTTTSTLTAVPEGPADADGDAITYLYQWYEGGVASGGTGVTYSGTLSTGDQISVAITPFDGLNAGTPQTSPAVVVGNSAPVVTSVAVSPDPGYETSTLSCVVTTSDADGDAVTTTIDWLVNGVSRGSSSVLVGGSFSKGDTVACRALPSDGTTDGVAVTSAAIDILNSQPTISSVSISPTSGSESTLFTCSVAGALDADGDAISFQFDWLVDGVPLGVTSASLGGAYFNRGSTVACEVTPDDGEELGTPVSSAAVVIANSLPVVSGIVISPSNPKATDVLSVAASFTDADGDAVAGLYQWYLNGTASSGATTTTFSGAAAGDQVEVEVTPFDGTDFGTALMSASVVIGNSAPTVSSASITPSSGNETTVFTCVGGFTYDADGDAVTLRYRWYRNGSLIPPSTQTLTGSDFSRGDEIYCAVVPYDGLVEGTALTSAVVTIENAPPTVGAISVSPSPAYETSVLSCLATGINDADGDLVTLTYAWTVNGVDAGVTSASLGGAYFNRGNQVSCSVVPNDGVEDGTTAVASSVTISNAKPSIASVSVSPATPNASSTVTCVPGPASDPDGDTVTFLFAWTKNGSAASGETSSTFGGSKARGDTLSCTATPFDGTDSGLSLTSATVTVVNSPPSVSSVTLTPDPAYETTTLTCTATASDPEGDAVTLNYDWYINSVRQVSGSSNTLTGTSFKKTDSVYCVAIPSDSFGAGTSGTSNTVSILNTAPTHSATTMNPASGNETTTFTCSATGAFDVDGDSVLFTSTWLVNGSAVGATSSSLGGSYFNRGDTVQCAMTPNDGTTSGTTLSSAVVTIGNSAPSATSASISPGSPEVGDTLTVTVSGWFDADGDAAGYLYSWAVNSTTVASTATLAAPSFKRGDQVSVTVTPFDGTSSGFPITAPPVFVQNSAPTVTSVSLTPTSPTASDALTCTPSASDVDGDGLTYSYVWYINGSIAGGAGGNTLSASFTSGGDVIYCTASANDGFASSSSVASNIVTVDNSAPVVTVVTVTPTTAYETTNLTCTPTGSDADGDPITYTYRWLVNSSTVSGATSSTLTGSSFSKNDYVACGAVASDGSSTSSELLSSSVLILNSTPSATSVAVSPNPPTHNAPVSATVTGWTDADGDAAGYLYSWYVNGSLVSSAATLDASLIKTYDIVWVTVTPYDGAAAGTPLTAPSVQVINQTPSAPSVSISPNPAQPEDNLTCNLVTSSTDPDGDPITYVYSWYDNGVLTGYISSVLPYTATADGDRWECQATASDGTASATSGAASVLVEDTASPAAPYLTPGLRYVNEATYVLAGTCDVDTEVIIQENYGSGSTYSRTPCTSSGTFSVSISLGIGLNYTLTGTSEDSAGNLSGTSNSVLVSRCSYDDKYDSNLYTSSYGDYGGDPVDVWGTLGEGSVILVAEGNIPDDDGEDWYVVHATDLGETNVNTFDLQVDMITGTSEFEFYIYIDGYTAPFLECASTPGYDEYNFYNWDQGDAPDHGIPANPQACATGSALYNECEDLSADFHIQVVRNSTTDSCSSYKLEITNSY